MSSGTDRQLHGDAINRVHVPGTARGVQRDMLNAGFATMIPASVGCCYAKGT